MALVILGLAACFPSGAVAAPTVSFTAQLAPIPGYPGTGDVYGAGAAVAVDYRTAGGEDSGVPQPLAGINLYLPTGTKLHPAGFATCPPAELEPTGKGPMACPAASRAGPRTEGSQFAWFGGPVKEIVTVEPFFAPGGGIELFMFGHTPFNREVLAAGTLANARGIGGFGPELELRMTPAVSTESIEIRMGAGFGPTSPSQATYYVRLPKKAGCPPRGFRTKSEVMFAASSGVPQQTVTVESRIACPHKRTRRRG